MVSGVTSRSREPQTLTADEIAAISHFMHARSGILLGEAKRYLIESRLNPIARHLGLPSITEICRRLKRGTDRHLETLVIDALTTNETFWFRDVRPFAALETTIFPEIHARKRYEKRLDIWSAACSTGQEPYSLAMLLLESGLFRGWRLRICATDISEHALEQARRGVYSSLEIKRGLPAKYVPEFFQQKNDGTWQIRAGVRRIVEFQFHNLKSSPLSPGSFDLIFCRNLLIYFDFATKKKVLHRLHKSLRRYGLLSLGGAESTIGLTDLFETCYFEKAVFYRRKIDSRG